VLDTLVISEETKSFAEATFMKKKMYYNMRIKTLQRCVSSLAKLLQKATRIKLDSLNEDFSNIQLKLAELVHAQSVDKRLETRLKIMYQEKSEEISNLGPVYKRIKQRLYET